MNIQNLIVLIKVIAWISLAGNVFVILCRAHGWWRYVTDERYRLAVIANRYEINTNFMVPVVASIVCLAIIVGF